MRKIGLMVTIAALIAAPAFASSYGSVSTGSSGGSESASSHGGIAGSFSASGTGANVQAYNGGVDANTSTTFISAAGSLGHATTSAGATGGAHASGSFSSGRSW